MLPRNQSATTLQLLLLTLQSYMGFSLLHHTFPGFSIFDELAPVSQFQLLYIISVISFVVCFGCAQNMPSFTAVELVALIFTRSVRQPNAQPPKLWTTQDFLSGFSPLVECSSLKPACHPFTFAAVIHSVAQGPPRGRRSRIFFGRADSQMVFLWFQ